MKKEEYLKRAYELGFTYERDYHGCAQSTIASVQDVLDIRNDLVFRAASSLAGGTGKLGDGPCGGYSGGAMIISMLFGRRRKLFDNDDEAKQCSDRLVKILHDRFVEHYGSVICREVQKSIFGRSYNLLDPEEYEIFERDGAHIDKCTTIVGTASQWVVEIILEEISKIGSNMKDLGRMICI